MPSTPPRKRVNVLGLLIDPVTYEEAVDRIEGMVDEGGPHFVCVNSIQDVMIAQEDERFRRIVNGADLATPDGWPVVWALRAFGHRQESRVTGPDLALEKLAEAPAGLYCGASHPLAVRAGPVSAGEVAALPFCAPATGPRASTVDLWPAYLPRRFAMTAANLAAIVEACAGGRYLAVLPDLLAARRDDLHRLAGWELLPPYVLYAARRERLSGERRGPVDVIVDLVRAEAKGGAPAAG